MAIYSDLNNINPDADPLLFDIESIYSSVQTILTINKGERVFLPTFGSNLEDLLFELINDDTALIIYQTVIEAIEKWEPRVSLDYGNSTVEAIPDENKYNIKLIFSIIGLDNQKFEFAGSLIQ